MTALMSSGAVDPEEVTFDSGADRCAGWFYRPAATVGDGVGDALQRAGGAPCVVMAHGFSLTRHDGLAPYAEALAAAGAAVLVFDHRFLGDSGGRPRQRFRRAEQLADWERAIAWARTRPGVDPEQIVLWGFSFSGGHVVTRALEDRRIAAVLALCPFVDGLGRVRATSPGLVAWILPRALADLAGRLVTIPVTGPPGSRAAMNLPGEAEGFAAATAGDATWRNEISPGLFAGVARIRPVTRAGGIAMPLWVGCGERDISVDRASVERLAADAPHSELHHYPVDHFEPFGAGWATRIASDQVAFLRRQGILAPG
jgi:pimeloyl-ACP methyl ester carboxylesterase